MSILWDVLANFLAKKFVKWFILIVVNIIGISSVVGIPVVTIIDVLFILMAIQSTIVSVHNGVVCISPYVRKFLHLLWSIFKAIIILSIVYAIWLAIFN